MNLSLLEKTTAAVAQIQTISAMGRIATINSERVGIIGLSTRCRLGDGVEIQTGNGRLRGEIISLESDVAQVLFDGSTQGLNIGLGVSHLGPPRFSPDDNWIGRVIDPYGAPLDGKPIAPNHTDCSVIAPPPKAHSRGGLGERLETGLAVFNTFLPIVEGQRVGLFSGSGVGKSTLIAELARRVETDVVVIGLVGERGRELRQFVQDVLGPSGMAKSIVVAATSDRAPHVRKRCALSAMAVAEFFRNRGKRVMLLIDSMTRFCEAHRELSLAAGETATFRGFPASMNTEIAQLCERAGPGPMGTAPITAIFSVLVAASDMDEPVADMLRGVLDGHVVLSRDIAERGRFPAVDVLRSVSRALPDAANKTENAALKQARVLLSDFENAEMMVQSGLYKRGSDTRIDTALSCNDALETFLATADGDTIANHFLKLRKIIGGLG